MRLRFDEPLNTVIAGLDPAIHDDDPSVRTVD
jgi:hypothetical protein